MRYPELTAAALDHLDTNGCSDGYSTSRTCEMSLSNHSGINFRGLVYLLDGAPFWGTQSIPFHPALPCVLCCHSCRRSLISTLLPGIFALKMKYPLKWKFPCRFNPVGTDVALALLQRRVLPRRPAERRRCQRCLPLLSITRC